MFAYYFQLGLSSLRRNPALTALMVMAIGFGVAASMITYSVFRAVSGDPMPWKSGQLFVPQIDSWGPKSLGPDAEPADQLGYLDAMALMNVHAAPRQAALYSIKLPLESVDKTGTPFTASGYATTTDFFSMFEVPFRYGSGWSAADDAQHASDVVISSKLNQQLFSGANSVGRELRLDDHDYRIVGVLQPWDPHPRFYDVASSNGGYGGTPDFFLPFSRAVDLQIEDSGGMGCNGHAGKGWNGFLHGQCVWVSLWVELPDASAVQRYKSFLQGYAAEQRRAGRFNWAPNVRLRNLTQWLNFEHVVPQESKVSLLLGLGFLVVCLVNTVGLLLAKFMRRAGEIGVRRALGASHREIYMQFLIEAGTVGLAGGLLGLLLTGVGVFGVRLVFEPDIARLAHLDITLIGMTLLLAIGATLIAALYPTWRAARVQPACQLKSN